MYQFLDGNGRVVKPEAAVTYTEEEKQQTALTASQVVAMYTKPKPAQTVPAVTPNILKTPGQKDDILDIVNEVTKIESQLT